MQVLQQEFCWFLYILSSYTLLLFIMFDEHDSEIEFPIVSYDNWLQLAHQTWKQDNGDISIAKAAHMYKVNKSTL